MGVKNKVRGGFADREKKFLDSVYSTYKIDDAPQVQAMRDLIMQNFSPFIKGGRGLELGCSDGYMTSRLAGALESLDVIDGSEKFIKQARLRNPGVNFIYSLFEEYELKKGAGKYDSVFAVYILEHVLDAKVVLRMARSVLKPDGLLFVIVPNARALSRQLALHVGLIKDLKP